MLTILPFFFAAGFGVGYYSVILRNPLALAVGAIAIVLFAFSDALGLAAVGLGLAGAVVGALGGRWFRKGGTRDQLGFLAGAGLFLFLAALEYDNKIFRNLSKIGGSEFSVEFSSQGQAGRSNNTPPVVSVKVDNLNDVFPGGSGIKYATETLASLPDAMVRDEQYARLFAAVDHSGLLAD